MKKLIIFTAVILLAGLVACSEEQQADMQQTMEDSNEQAQQVAADVADWSGEKWNSFVASTEDALNNMQSEWSQMQEDFSEQWSGQEEGTVADLKTKIDQGLAELDETVNKMQDASGEQWENLKKKSESLKEDISGWMSDLKAEVDAEAEADTSTEAGY